MERILYLDRISAGFSTFPIVALLGPRQCGKTTLARAYGGFEVASVTPSSSEIERRFINYFDLEDPEDLARLSNPKLALSQIEGLVVIDEIQRLPELFPTLRVLVDRRQNKTRFLILGSASRDLIRQGSESLAGRIQYLELTPFSLGEVGVERKETRWLRGGFPRSFLARSDKESFIWLESYIRTFLERDIPQLGIQIAAAQLRRFWLMLTNNHGQIANISDLGRSFGISETTVRRYLDILAGTFMIRLLPPWHENISKRQIKRPKLLLRDSGIFHRLMGIGSMSELHLSPKLGASWEGFALEAIIQALAATEEEVYFWGVHQQMELDLLVIRDGKKHGFEIKYSDAPTLSKSMRAVRDVLSLDSLTVIYPGTNDYTLNEKIMVRSLGSFVSEISN